MTSPLSMYTSPCAARITSLKSRHVLKLVARRAFTISTVQCIDSRTLNSSTEDGALVLEEHNGYDFDDAVAQSKEKQTRTPWHRDGSRLPPVARPRIAGAMVKGKAI